MQASSRKVYYAFDLPQAIVDSLHPFKIADSDDSVNFESEDSDEYSEDSDSPDSLPASATYKTQYVDNYEDMDEWKAKNLSHMTGTPFVYFSSSLLPENKVLAVYKSLLDKTLIAERPVESLRDLKLEGKSAVLLVGGGHFSGAIISHVRGKHKLNITNPFANINVLESKAFHRYTVRKKQGGAQGASDSARGKANSAGSTIRRQNEQALKQEIQQLLSRWAPLLAECQHIFIRAAGRSNRGLLQGYPNAPIAMNDPRVKTVPFSTKRPTFDETRRVWLQLTKAEIVDEPDIALKPKPSKASQPVSRETTPALEPEVDPEVAHTDAIVDAIKKSRLAPLKALLGSNLDLELSPAGKYRSNPTPLLLAAALDKPHVVSELLELGASPMIKAGPQSIWEIAGERAKEALQISRKSLGENAWDWKQANVGQPRSKEEILEEKTAQKLTLQDQRKQELATKEKKEKEHRIEKLISKHGAGRATGGQAPSLVGLSEDEKRHIDREKRARAAEARLSRLAGR